MSPCHSQCRKQSPHRLCWKPSATDFHWKVPCFPRSSSYFAFFFIALPHLPYHWNIKSMTMIFFILVDQSTISGPRLVGTMSGNFSFCYKSTANCQSCFWSKIPEVLLSCLSIALRPSLTGKGIRTGFSFRSLHPSYVFLPYLPTPGEPCCVSRYIFPWLRHWGTLWGYGVELKSLVWLGEEKTIISFLRI